MFNLIRKVPLIGNFFHAYSNIHDLWKSNVDKISRNKTKQNKKQMFPRKLECVIR